jgi:lipopolysaccharide transport system ATP-binding protein
MSQPVISVENLSKSYLIGHQGPRERYTSLRDTLSQHAKNFTRRTIDTLRGKQMLQGNITEEFWALKDVSFEVQQGEVLGIIGRNGAGKSTLLKVLSRITEPTSGKVTIRGRVASLLEVGTGFHPELSGRENIFLNGAILGMSRKEIKAKFDEIVDFAGVERFLDTPVKRYSSGMYVRLAFAVAAHLEPEILVVDEVLAVGDAEFQKKCMGKMKDVAGGGRTVIFVSHNLKAVNDLCSKSCFLQEGKLVELGPTGDVMKTYVESTESHPRPKLREMRNREGEQGIRFTRINYRSDGKSANGILQTASDVEIELEYEMDQAAARSKNYRFSIDVGNATNHLFTCSTELTEHTLPDLAQFGKVVCRIPKLPLSTGFYTLAIFCEMDGRVQDWVREADRFEVIWGSFFPTQQNCPKGHEGHATLVPHNWKITTEG